MSSIPVIKNPYRLSPKEIKKEDFTPAYKKMGIKPVIVDPVSNIESQDKFEIPNVGFSSADDNYFDVEQKNDPVNKDEYYLFIGSDFIQSGTFSEIERLASDLVSGNHEINSQRDVSPDSIIVFKKINIKIGVFLDG